MRVEMGNRSDRWAPTFRHRRLVRWNVFAILCGSWIGHASGQVPFSLHMPGVNPAHYRLTTFATGLAFPVGMAELPDGSLLVAETPGSYFGASRGSLVRLADTDGDGVSDERTVLNSQVPGGALSALRIAGDYVFATGQGKPISIFRLGENPTDPISQIGQINVTYPAAWLHPHSALYARQTDANSFDLYFQVGSDKNMAETTRTVQISSPFGISQNVAGDSVHRVSLTIEGNTVSSSQPILQVATGLRNATGFAWDERTGDLYIAENGIDGLVDANEPTSADELNVIRNAQVARDPAIDFGFPQQYIEYRTGKEIGGVSDGSPLVAIQPIPDPMTGSEAEGPNDIALIPDSFPFPLQGGILMGMHGKWAAAGIANEENPLVFIHPERLTYDHLIGNDEASIGHLDGLLATEDSIYMADISSQGAFGSNQATAGRIYRMQSLYPSVDRLAQGLRDGSNDLFLDVNRDGQINVSDHTALIEEINRTYLGDSNFDGQFNSTDLVQVFAAGRYEQDELAQWRDGDWNGDGRFSSTDLLVAFQGGGYDAPPRSLVVATVPEPMGLVACGLALSGLIRTHRRARSNRSRT